MDLLQNTSGIVIIVVAVLAVFLAVLTVLMPYFVWQIHDNVQKLREMAEGWPRIQASGLEEVTLGTMEEIRDALKSSSDAQDPTEPSTDVRTLFVAALAEQQRTINALRRRLDELEGTSRQHQKQAEPGGEFAPPIPLEEALGDDGVEPPN